MPTPLATATEPFPTSPDYITYPEQYPNIHGDLWLLYTRFLEDPTITDYGLATVEEVNGEKLVQLKLQIAGIQYDFQEFRYLIENLGGRVTRGGFNGLYGDAIIFIPIGHLINLATLQGIVDIGLYINLEGYNPSPMEEAMISNNSILTTYSHIDGPPTREISPTSESRLPIAPNAINNPPEYPNISGYVWQEYTRWLDDPSYTSKDVSSASDGSIITLRIVMSNFSHVELAQLLHNLGGYISTNSYEVAVVVIRIDQLIDLALTPGIHNIYLASMPWGSGEG